MRFFGILLAAALAAVPLFARADDAASLLAKHKAFTGWQFGDGTFNTLSLDGDETQTQRDGTTKRLFDLHKVVAGVAKRTTTKNLDRGTVEDTGFTGRVYWSTNDNGFVQPEIGDLQKFDLAYDLLFNEATPLLKGVVQGTKVIDGTQTTIVRVQAVNADPIDLYVDPQTGEYKQAVIDPDGTYEQTLHLLGYSSPLPGKKMLSKWSWNDDKEIDEWTKIAANVPVTDAELHPPAQTAAWKFGSGNPFSIKLTQYRILVDATVNGVKGTFILDTGSDGIVLAQHFADRAHVKPFGTREAYGIGGNAKTSMIRINTLQVGDNTLSNVVADAQQMEHFDADGLLGFDLFAGAIVHLDLSHRQMTIYDPSKMSVDKTAGIVATVDISDGTPHLPMKLNGHIAVNALMDTGDPDEVLYGPDMIWKYGVTSLRADYISAGIGGYETEECGYINEIEVGPIHYQQPPACKSPSFSGRDILIGLDFLRNFDYVFDYPESTIVMIPRKTDQTH